MCIIVINQADPQCEAAPQSEDTSDATTIKDMTVQEYMEVKEKSCFYRPAAKVPKLDHGHQCSLFERESMFHQEIPPKDPVLSVLLCMFICKCRFVCVCAFDCACLINNVWLVPLPGASCEGHQ